MTDAPYDFETYEAWQIDKVNTLAAPLRREDYQSEEEYKKALIAQYKALRNEEYQAVCYATCIDMYHGSRTVNIATRNTDAMDSQIWNGCNRVSLEVLPADSTARRTPAHVMYQYTNVDKMACCAVTGSTIAQKICEDMNCMNGANIVKFAGVPNKIVPANTFKYYHTGAGHFTWDPSSRGYCNSGKKVALGPAIKSGQIGPGDRLSFKYREPTATSTGCHERTVASVDKDEKGNVIGYTLVENNPTKFTYHKINDPKDPFNTFPVSYSSTNAWMKNQIELEGQYMENLSVEEIQQMINQSKENAVAKIEKSVEIEQTLLTDTKFTSNKIEGKYQTGMFTTCFKSRYKDFVDSGYTAVPMPVFEVEHSDQTVAKEQPVAEQPAPATKEQPVVEQTVTATQEQPVVEQTTPATKAQPAVQATPQEKPVQPTVSAKDAQFWDIRANKFLGEKITKELYSKIESGEIKLPEGIESKEEFAYKLAMATTLAPAYVADSLGIKRVTSPQLKANISNMTSEDFAQLTPLMNDFTDKGTYTGKGRYKRTEPPKVEVAQQPATIDNQTLAQQMSADHSNAQDLMTTMTTSLSGQNEQVGNENASQQNQEADANAAIQAALRQKAYERG